MAKKKKKYPLRKLIHLDDDTQRLITWYQHTMRTKSEAEAIRELIRRGAAYTYRHPARSQGGIEAEIRRGPKRTPVEALRQEVKEDEALERLRRDPVSGPQPQTEDG